MNSTFPSQTPLSPVIHLWTVHFPGIESTGQWSLNIIHFSFLLHPPGKTKFLPVPLRQATQWSFLDFSSRSRFEPDTRIFVFPHIHTQAFLLNYWQPATSQPQTAFLSRDSAMTISIQQLTWTVCAALLGESLQYCKFGNIRENFIFANIDKTYLRR